MKNFSRRTDYKSKTVAEKVENKIARGSINSIAQSKKSLTNCWGLIFSEDIAHLLRLKNFSRPADYKSKTVAEKVEIEIARGSINGIAQSKKSLTNCWGLIFSEDLAHLFRLKNFSRPADYKSKTVAEKVEIEIARGSVNGIAQSK